MVKPLGATMPSKPNFYYIVYDIYIFISEPGFGRQSVVSYCIYFQSSWPVQLPQLSIILWLYIILSMLSLTNIILFYIYFLIALPLPYISFFIYYFILVSVYCSFFWWQAEPPVQSFSLLSCDYLFKLINCFPVIFFFLSLFLTQNLLQMCTIEKYQSGSVFTCCPVSLMA